MEVLKDSVWRIFAKEKPKKIFLVTGKKSFESSGAKSIFEKILFLYHVEHFHDFSENPKIEDIKRGIGIFRKFNPDITVAVGGGSVMDMAKSINALSANEGLPEDYVMGAKKLEQRGKPLITVPTTAGSGSEVTHFAVVYIGKQKYSLAHPSMLPSYSVIDPSLTFNLPPRITASTGIDALSQAIESFWSKNATEESKKYSKEAARLAFSSLRQAVNSPTPESREKMSKAANLAGKAINIAKTTACHAISYPITAYFGVPHGHAVGLTLPQMFLYNAETMESSKLEELLSLFGAQTPEEASELLTNLMVDIGLETKLSELKIDSAEAKKIILEDVFKTDRVKNNPRLLTREALEKILEGIK